MEVLHERCCGIDIHKRSVTACVLTPGTGGCPAKEVRRFGTMTDELLGLGDWLAEAGVTRVAMESWRRHGLRQSAIRSRPRLRRSATSSVSPRAIRITMSS